MLAAGTYLRTLEIPVRITSDPRAADQTDLMHAFWPLSFVLWILAFVLFIYSMRLYRQIPTQPTDTYKHLAKRNIVIALIIGAIAVASLLLPWANITPLRGGDRISLSGISLISNYYWAGDVIYLIFISGAISCLYIPLISLYGKKDATPWDAFLFFLAGSCILGSVFGILTFEYWTYSISFISLLAKFESPGIGLIIGAASGLGFIALGANRVLQSVRNACKEAFANKL